MAGAVGLGALVDVGGDEPLEVRTRRGGDGLELQPPELTLFGLARGGLDGTSDEHIAGDRAVVAVLLQRALEPVGLARRQPRRRRQRRVHLLDRRALLLDVVQPPVLDPLIAELVDLQELLFRVDEQHQKRHVAEERLLRQPQHEVAVFADRPADPDVFQLGIGLAEDVDALRFELVEVVHAGAPEALDRLTGRRHRDDAFGRPSLRMMVC